MKPPGSAPAPRGGVTDPRVALPVGLMVVVFGIFLSLGASGAGGWLLAVAVTVAGAAYLVAGLVRWGALRRSGNRPGSDPPL